MAQDLRTECLLNLISDYEKRLLGNEFSEIIKMLNQALERLQRFREEYPYLIAPNVFETIEENLKENSHIMLRELQNMMRAEGPYYQKKYVCKNCHQVFLMSLPDGLCDECRSKNSGQ